MNFNKIFGSKLTNKITSIITVLALLYIVFQIVITIINLIYTDMNYNSMIKQFINNAYQEHSVVQDENNIYIDEDNILDIDKIKKKFDIDEDLSVIIALDYSVNNQDDEKEQLMYLLENYDENKDSYNVIVNFDNDSDNNEVKTIFILQ